MVKFTLCKTWMVTLSIWKIVLETKEWMKVVKILNFFKFFTLMFYVSRVGELLQVVEDVQILSSFCSRKEVT